MGISLRTNMASLRAAKQVTQSNEEQSDSLNKLTTGQRINAAADDSGGQGVASTMESDNTSFKQAIRNTNDGISMIQTAEGSLDSLTSIITRLREITIQASNETYTAQDRSQMDTEYIELISEISRAVSTTQFNRQSILNATSTYTIQIGIHADSGNQLNIDLSRINSSLGSLGITSRVHSLDTGGGFYDRTAIDILDKALTSLNTRRSYLGSIQRRLENSLNSAIQTSEDLAASSSKIMDTDYASESANATRSQIMHQSGVAAMGQAKTLPQNIISLLS